MNLEQAAREAILGLRHAADEWVPGFAAGTIKRLKDTADALEAALPQQPESEVSPSSLQGLRFLAQEAADEAERESEWFDPGLIESREPILSSQKARRFIAAMTPHMALRLIVLADRVGRQEVPRELVVRIDRETVIRLAREAVSNGDGSELSGDAIERFAQLVFLEAASPSTAQQQEAGSEALDARRFRWLEEQFAGMKTSASLRVLGAFGIEYDAAEALSAAVDAAMLAK